MIKLILEINHAQSIWQQINIDRVLGIGGTLLGTLSGAILGYYFNKLGKISVYLKTWNELFYSVIHDKMGGRNIVKENPDHYEYKMTLEIHNSSNTPKIIRDVRIAFRKKKKDLIVATPKDSSTLHTSGPVRYCDDIGSLNIPANEIITIELEGININVPLIREADSVWLVFKDYRNKTQRRLIKKLNYTESHV